MKYTIDELYEALHKVVDGNDTLYMLGMEGGVTNIPLIDEQDFNRVLDDVYHTIQKQKEK